jgi:hypothetical protein
MLGVRSRATLYLILIFMCGLLSGALGARWMERISVSADSSAAADIAQDRKGAVKWFVKGLDLNQQQLDQLSEILQETRSAYKEHELQIESIKQHSRVRIREILTDEQKLTYDRLLAERARKEREEEALNSR